MKAIICFLFLICLANSQSCDKRQIIKFCLKTNLLGFKGCVSQHTELCQKTEVIPTTDQTPFEQIQTTTANTFEQIEANIIDQTDEVISTTSSFERTVSFEQTDEVISTTSSFEQTEATTFEQNLIDQTEANTFDQTEAITASSFEQTDTFEQIEVFPTSIVSALPTDGPCKKINLDYQLISKVCVQRKSLKFCLTHYPTEFDDCVRSTKYGLCYKKCFVNITTCFYQIPIKINNEKSARLTNQTNLTYQHKNSSHTNLPANIHLTISLVAISLAFR